MGDEPVPLVRGGEGRHRAALARGLTLLVVYCLGAARRSSARFVIALSVLTVVWMSSTSK
jgi:hypothetical protein